MTRRCHARACRLLGSTRAAAAAELAIILPVLMLMVAGIVELGRLFEVYDASNRLATQYALAWANCSESGTDTGGVCASELPNYTNASAIGNVVPQLTLADLTLTMVEFTKTQGSGTVTAIYTGGNTGGTANTTGDPTQLADATTKAGTAFSTYPSTSTSTNQYIVIVEVKYAHSLAFFNTLMSPFLSTNILTPSYTVVQLKS